MKKRLNQEEKTSLPSAFFDATFDAGDQRVCGNCNNRGKRNPYCVSAKCRVLGIDVKPSFSCASFDNYQASFRTITILSGPEMSGKSVQAGKMCAGKKFFEVDFQGFQGDFIWEVPIDTEVVVFEGVTSLKQIKRILKTKLPVEEIIICITL